MDCLSRLKYILLVVAVLLTAACGSSGGSNDGPTNLTVTFPETDTSTSLDFDFSSIGSGKSLIGEINIDGSQGTIVINNQTVNTIIYARIPWESANYNLYQGIAFSDTDFFIYWLYCNTTNDSLDQIYYESTDQYEITRELASGTCNVTESASRPSFSFSERDIGISRLVSGYTITGSDISLISGQVGALVYNGVNFAFYPFEDVDCSNCSEGPWWELHSIAHDDIGQTTCFTILYLFPDSADTIFSSYSICFPELDDINANLSGTWLVPNISSAGEEFPDKTSYPVPKRITETPF